MSEAVKVGASVPDFSLPSTAGQFTLSDHKGAHIVLYFYPRDNTPGCTAESIDFRDAIEAFAAVNTKVFGISRDTLKAHEKFCSKYDLPFELLSDEEETVCAMFEVIKGKTMFGKKVRGIQRSTFVLDKKGILRKEWRKVSVGGHAAEVLSFVKTL